MRQWQVYFYNGASITISGANYMDAVQKYGINTAQVMSFREL